MATYSRSDFEKIAAAAGVSAAEVVKHSKQFEAAARWYRSDRRRSARTAPSKLRAKLERVANNSRRLLKSLAIHRPADAADGPGDRELFDALVMAGEPNEETLLEATRRIGRFTEIIEGPAAAAELERRAKTAATEIAELGRLTVREGNVGDTDVNDWIAWMMTLYRVITGNEIATSVGAPGRSNEGIAGGPLIRFLSAAGRPLGIDYSEDAWRKRLRSIQRSASVQN